MAALLRGHKRRYYHRQVLKWKLGFRVCLILLAIDSNARYPLVIGANRDEYYARPTRPMAPWPHAPQLLAGKDLQAGGTWMGLARSGRIAAVTNVREDPKESGQHSRGELPKDFLLGTVCAAQFAEQAHARGADYAGFNLLVGDASGIYYCSNRNQSPPRRLPAGVYGLSNATLDSPWPKVQSGTAALRELLKTALDPAQILAILADATQAAPAELPHTGITAEHERLLSSRFIASQDYGTRASTAVLVDSKSKAQVWEQNFTAGGYRGELMRFNWQLDTLAH